MVECEYNPLWHFKKQSERTVDKTPTETDYVSLKEIGSTIHSTWLCIIYKDLHIRLLCNLSKCTLWGQRKLERFGLAVSFTFTFRVDTRVDLLYFYPVCTFVCHSHPDYTSRGYSQSCNAESGYEKWAALINVTAQSIFLI